MKRYLHIFQCIHHKVKFQAQIIKIPSNPRMEILIIRSLKELIKISNQALVSISGKDLNK